MQQQHRYRWASTIASALSACCRPQRNVVCDIAPDWYDPIQSPARSPLTHIFTQPHRRVSVLGVHSVDSRTRNTERYWPRSWILRCCLPPPAQRGSRKTPANPERRVRHHSLLGASSLEEASNPGSADSPTHCIRAGCYERAGLAHGITVCKVWPSAGRLALSRGCSLWSP